MGYQGILLEMAKEYVVLATSQSQSLMCGGQIISKQSTDGWAPVEPQIVWNRPAVPSLSQASLATSEHQLAETTPEPAQLQPRLPQRNPGAQLDSPREAGPSRDEDLKMAPAIAEKSSAKETAAKGKKRFRIFRAMRSVIKGRFRK